MMIIRTNILNYLLSYEFSLLGNLISVPLQNKILTEDGLWILNPFTK
jgi:hypothetical protein